MSGISTADGLSAVDGGGSSAITIGTTTITGGTGGRVLYETSGNVVGEISGATSNGTALTLVAPVLAVEPLLATVNVSTVDEETVTV